MKKVILDVTARFKLERLCDAVHPEECGGVLFGSQNSETIWVNDVFPVPNVAENKNTTYKEHPWGNYWRDLFGRTINSLWLGTFHSHPNGSIPSNTDMRAYNDSNLHLWIIHHNKGEHTFQSSIGLTHIDLELASMPVRETLKPQFIDGIFHLGEITVDEHGRLSMYNLSAVLIKLNEKQRLAYLALLTMKDRWDFATTKDLAKKLNVTPYTANKWLKGVQQTKLIEKHYNGWKVLGVV